jgi:hypothetical protein
VKVIHVLMCALVLLIAALPTAPALPEKQTDSNAAEGKPISGPYTPPAGSVERKAILDAVRKEVKSWSGLDVVFVVRYLKVYSGWAWIATLPQSRDGLSHYEDVSGLLQRTKGEWKLVETRPGACDDEPECADDKTYFKKLRSRFPSAPPNIFPD